MFKPYHPFFRIYQLPPTTPLRPPPSLFPFFPHTLELIHTPIHPFLVRVLQTWTPIIKYIIQIVRQRQPGMRSWTDTSNLKTLESSIIVLASRPRDPICFNHFTRAQFNSCNSMC